jgi:hypothetical protein
MLPFDRSLLRALQLKFPLPPPTPPSTNRSIKSNDAFSVPSNPFDASESPRGSDSVPSTANPAHIHPIFINSDLNEKAKNLHLPSEAYPVDRLNPVCMGYFNHSEYEAAMSSIMVAEAMYQSSSAHAGRESQLLSSEGSLQHRRSISTFFNFSIADLENRSSSLWRERSAKLSLNLDMISRRNTSRIQSFAQELSRVEALGLVTKRRESGAAGGGG